MRIHHALKIVYSIAIVCISMPTPHTHTHSHIHTHTHTQHIYAHTHTYTHLKSLPENTVCNHKEMLTDMINAHNLITEEAKAEVS